MTADEFRELWQEQQGGHARLKWARMYWQMRAGSIGATATHAAHSIGLKPNTYAAYERAPDSSKHTTLDHQTAIRFAKRFSVNWQWLLLGEGTPFDDQLPEQQSRVVQVMSKATVEDQKIVADMIEAFFKARLAS